MLPQHACMASHTHSGPSLSIMSRIATHAATCQDSRRCPSIIVVACACVDLEPHHKISMFIVGLAMGHSACEQQVCHSVLTKGLLLSCLQGPLPLDVLAASQVSHTGEIQQVRNSMSSHVFQAVKQLDRGLGHPDMPKISDPRPVWTRSQAEWDRV